MTEPKILSIIIPCYNEAKNIPLLLERFSEVMQRDDCEVILVDNGSQDDTPEVLNALLPRFGFARSVRVKDNEGYGNGVLSGLRDAGGQYLAWTHADMQTDPADVLKAWDILMSSKEPHRSFIKGRRTARPWIDIFFTLGMGIFESLYLGVWMTDINAQPNLFHRSFFESWPDPPNDFSLDLYAFYLARKKRLRVIRFPVFFARRIHGRSHWNLNWKSRLTFIKRTIEFSFRMKRKVG